MPQYFFAVRSGNSDTAERAAELRDDAAAFAYACQIVRELTLSASHADRSSLVEVRDECDRWCFRSPSLRHPHTAAFDNPVNCLTLAELVSDFPLKATRRRAEGRRLPRARSAKQPQTARDYTPI
jgi:hypothetical protein